MNMYEYNLYQRIHWTAGPKGITKKIKNGVGPDEKLRILGKDQVCATYRLLPWSWFSDRRDIPYVTNVPKDDLCSQKNLSPFSPYKNG